MFEGPSEIKLESLTPNWIRPDLRNEVGEIKRALGSFLGVEPSRENVAKLSGKLEMEPLVELTDELWGKLENTDSFDKITKGDIDAVRRLTEEYNRELPEEGRRDVQSILNGFRNNRPMEAPAIMENEEGRIHLISGNTRLMVARALGIRPKVIIGKL